MDDHEYPREWARRATMIKAVRLALWVALVLVVGAVFVVWLLSPVPARCFDTIWEKGALVGCMDPRQRATKGTDGRTICVCEEDQ